MLVCKVCTKIIANTNPVIHYGICASCPNPSEDIKELNNLREHNDDHIIQSDLEDALLNYMCDNCGEGFGEKEIFTKNDNSLCEFCCPI